MSWKTCAPRQRFATSHPPIAHAGRIVWLWHNERESVAYDPRADRWDALADPFTTGTRGGEVLASLGDELIVWGGSIGSSRNFKQVNDGARLGPDGAWKPMASQRAPSQRSAAMYGWTGRELVVWGGWKSSKPVASGGAYDPTTDTWRKFAKTNAPALPLRGEYANSHRDCVWSGRELWMWSYDQGHAFDPAANTWRELAAVPGPAVRSDHGRAFLALDDGALLVRQNSAWGIDDDTCSAWRYDGKRDRWRQCKKPPAIKHARPAIVACGRRIVIGLREQVFEYNLARDTWKELPPPKLAHDPYLVWVADRLFACAWKGGAVKSLEL